MTHVPTQNCPIPKSAQIQNRQWFAAPNRYRAAIAAEAKKISALRVGLLAAPDHERDRYQYLKARASKLVTELNVLQNREAMVLTNARVEFTANPKKLAYRRSELSEQLSYFSEIQHITAEIERLKKASERKRITVYRAGGAFGREVAERAKELLNAWGFTAIQNIALDDERCDLRIDDRIRL